MSNVKSFANELSYETDVERTTWIKTNDSKGSIMIFQSVTKSDGKVRVKDGRNTATGKLEQSWEKCD